MRKFNKLFVIALPRCATVSTSDALGVLGVKTAHLGKIYGEVSTRHNDPQRLLRMHEQIESGDFKLDVLELCDGLADYPACIFEVVRHLDQAYPGSLYVNIKRDSDKIRWVQSVERQFVGLQLLNSEANSTEEEKSFLKIMLAFREMTFGQASFDMTAYLSAYDRYQEQIDGYFASRSDILTVPDIRDLELSGFQLLADFLQCPVPDEAFPRSNVHSELPTQKFMQALEEGLIQSQTGIKPAKV